MSFIDSKSFGVIVYMEPKEYSNNVSENIEIHIPISKESIVFGLLKYLYELGIGKNEVISITIGHEHGKENMKCHMQIFIKFKDKIRKCLKNGYFDIENKRYLCMFQKAKNAAKLQNYCKKDGDFKDYLPCETITNMLKEHGDLDILMDVDDPYEVLLNNKELKEEQIIDIFRNCKITEYRKDFICNSKKIFETYSKYLEENKENIPEFKWKFPEHMYNYIQNNFDSKDDKMLAYSKIYSWFKTYCEPENYFRRKALFLFSLAGSLGKSYFARGLVPEIKPCISPYYVYCRGTLDASEFIKKSKSAKIVILDDVNYINNDIEIWKALAVSEPTNIRTPYHNVPWFRSLPCILMSNNIKTLQYWMETDDLKSRCIFVGINFYIGPPGTDKPENHDLDSFVTEDINNKLKTKGVFYKMFS